MSGSASAVPQLAGGGSLFSGFTRLCKGLSVILVSGYALLEIFPSAATYLALIPARTIPFAWNLVTAGYIEQSLPGDMMATILKDLHSLLLKLSPGVSPHHVLGDATSVAVSNQSFTMKLKFIDIIDLSNMLYEKLHRQQVLLCGRFIPSVVAAYGKGFPTSDIKVSREGFIPLLRCCLTMMHFLEFDLSLVMEKCQTLILFLAKLCPQYSPLHLPNYTLEVGKRISGLDNAALCECSYASNGTNPEAGLRTFFLCAILEVLIDELLVQHELRKHFVMADYVSDKPEKLFVSHDNPGDSGAILELMSSHYLLTIYDEWTFNRFIHSLYWSKELDFETPELTLDAALILLGNPVILTAPHILQAHILLLASRCIGIQMPTNDKKSDVCMFERYMSAFELSVSLYAGYMSASEFGGYPIDDEFQSRLSFEGPSFGSCIRPVTREKLTLQTDKLVDFCYAQSQSVLFSSRADILSNFAAYIKENQHVIDELCRDEACLVLNSILSRMISSEIVKNIWHKNRNDFQQHMYCIAATMKLMSSSLLQIIWFLRKSGLIDGTKTLRDSILSSEYAFLSRIMSSFGKYSANQHVQDILLNAMETSSGRQKASQLMLAHITSLLLYNFNRRLEFLWKDCIFMMMTMMNFLFFEEGNLDVLRSFLGSVENNLTPQSSTSKVSQERSVIIASNIQNARKLYLRDQVEYLTTEDQWVDTGKCNTMGTEDVENQDPRTGADTCNGSVFVECLADYHRNPAEWEDLVDFIECKHGKDYSSWLKKRTKFRKWQHNRTTVTRSEQRKKSNRLQNRF